MGANLKFQLPAEAKLYVDGRLTMIGGTERAFTTPPLAAGSQFFYDVKAEWSWMASRWSRRSGSWLRPGRP